jgi:hypothetical protein
MKHATNLKLHGDGRLQLGGLITALLDFAHHFSIPNRTQFSENQCVSILRQ